MVVYSFGFVEEVHRSLLASRSEVKERKRRRGTRETNFLCVAIGEALPRLEDPPRLASAADGNAE